jgi:hypothetical protein
MRSTILPLAASLALAPAVFAVEPAATLAKADLPATPMPAPPAAEMGMAAADSTLTAEQTAFFESKVRPILSAACYKCHSLAEGKAKGGLTLDTKEGTLKGGDTGAAVTPGDPTKSLLVTAITYNDADLQMPPKGEKLKEEEIAVLTEWVKMGAPDPRKAAATATKLTGLTDKARHHWAFQPVKKAPLPAVKNQTWTLMDDRKTVHPIDTFVLAKIEEKGMLPGPAADRDTLLRRASYDLLGLPPSPQELEAFRYDKSPNAWANVIDRLLASPHYGERWGRFWLDTARYADTIGGDRNANNRGQDYRYPFAWTYRDWVVKSMNQDMPYDKFIMAQLAADRMPETKRDPRLLSAMGFLTVGERFPNANDQINDKIDTVTKGFLGLTVACARCHDHMFDPIPTKDYYALHGIFSSIEEPDNKPLVNAPSAKQLEEFSVKLAAFEQKNREEYYRVLGEYAAMFREKAGVYLQAADLRRDRSQTGLQKVQALQDAEKLDVDIVQYLSNRGRMDNVLFSAFRKFATLSESDFSSLGNKIASDIAGASGSQYHPAVAAAFRGAKITSMQDVIGIYNKLFSGLNGKAADFFKTVAASKSGSYEGVEATAADTFAAPFPVQPVAKLDSDSIRDHIADWPLRMRGRPQFTFGAINSLYLTHPGAPAKAMIVADKSNPQDSRVFIRGQAGVPGDVVPRRFLDILSPGGKSQEFRDGSGRYELAKAIANKDNPLTARVMVNRVWLHHFGEGFVRTPDDLGTQSETPSHPELIDYLSAYFMDNGWSLKTLHRFIMTSRVYQISSHTRKEYEDIDPYNRLLWRANVRRLDFEAMRDSLLVYGGILDKTVGGQPVNLTDEPYSRRRSVYGYIDRGNVPELMSAFDFSDPDMTNSKRSTTVVPQQALFLMNSSMSVDAARRIISRPEVANARDGTARVLAIHNIIFQRNPQKEEIPFIYEFLNKERNLNQFVDDKAKKALADAAAKKNAEVEKKLATPGNMRDNMFGTIRNTGEIVDRKALSDWETYAQALLLSNEAAYVN